MGTRRSIFVGGEEEGIDSGVIGQRGDYRQGGGNATRNYDGPVMRGGVQSSNLI